MTNSAVVTHESRQRPRLTGETLALLARFPPRPLEQTWNATSRSREWAQRRLLAPPFATGNTATQHGRRYALVKFLDWLQAQPGKTWQERWNASGLDTGGRADPNWKAVPAEWLKRTGRVAPDSTTIDRTLGSGLTLLISGDVIRPSIPWLLTSRTLSGVAAEFARVRDPNGFADLHATGRDRVVSHISTQGALNRITFILAAKGGTVRDITVGDCIELVEIAHQYGRYGTGGESAYFYQLLHAVGAFPAGAPPTVRMISTVRRGQDTPEELIDRYDLACRPVRDLLVDYLRERQSALVYTSFARLASHLGQLFWKDLEENHPGISSLDLPPDVAVAWKHRVRTKPAGGPSGDVRVARSDVHTILSNVRAFFLDIAQWAAEDPARWGQWAARCPVKPADMQVQKAKSARKSRMDQRTRERLPVVDILADALDRARGQAAEILDAARKAAPGEEVTVAGTTLRRAVVQRRSLHIWAEDVQGTRRNLIREESNAFWAWAAVEVMRHTGIRVGELIELTHHSLVQYQVPDTGEVVPLLHVVPSKNDQERLLVISPELADVLATVLQRVRAKDGSVPLVAVYGDDRVWSPPMPLLFQRPAGIENVPFGKKSVEMLIADALAGTSLRDAQGEPLRFAPHDFRRIFATEAILNGMPPHIAQLLLGHKDINVTIGYKAVYPEESISAHRAFLARRRELRAGEEYRSPTDEEWDDFLGHFQRRRLELGECGRAYGTSCIHEHSCIRCSLLRVDPAQRPRLESIRDNLADRIAEAEHEGWTGEAEGLRASRSAAVAKLEQLDTRTIRRTAVVNLGLPAYRDIAGRVAAAPADQP
jgi:site-specific recombinase XerD